MPLPAWQRWIWLVVLLGVAAATAVYYLPALGEGGRAVLYVGTEAVPVLGVLLSLALGRQARRGAWALIAVGLACVTAGDLFWFLITLGGQDAVSPSFADVLYLAEYPFLLLGALRLVHERPARTIVLDAILVVGAATVVAWEFLLRPLVGGPADSELATIVAAAYPIADLALAGVLTGIFFSTGLPSAAVRLLAAGFLVTFVADVLNLRLTLVGLVPDPSPLDAGWLVAMGLMAAAALHPSAAAKTHLMPETPRRWRVGHLALLTTAGLVVPFTLVALEMTGQDPDIPVLVTVWTVMVIVVAYRVAAITSELRGSEATLQTSERNYRTLFESNPQPMWVYDVATLRFLAVNELAVIRYGWTREEFLAMTIADIRPPEDVAVLLRNVAEEQDPIQSSGPWRHRHKDGSTIDVEITSHGLRWEGRDARLVLAMDITERLGLEQQLRQAQKMEAIGRLAGGVAHDFNNLLTAISGYAEVLRADLGEGDPRTADVVEILKAGKRAATLTRQLLAFSRRQVLRPQVMDLNAVVLDTKPMLARLIGEDIHVRTKVAPGPVLVRADPGQIMQVLMNLAVNARDAMPRGGSLSIETGAVSLDETFTRTHSGMRPGDHALLAVTDTGRGMTRETMDHVFEPFFTTKDVGQGTGLGLATVYGIVKQSGGSIWVYSEPGRGATFKIYLPRVTPSGDPSELDASTPVADHVVRTETILLVEDEAAVRGLVTRLLERAGYRALVAATPDEADAIAGAHPGIIDLLITDVVMPGRNGAELAAGLQGARPQMRTLFMSGYTQDAIVHDGVLDPGVAFIGKPFAQAEFLAKVREALDREPEATLR